MVAGTCRGAAVFSLYFQRRPARLDLADELTNKSISSVELVGVETTAKGTQQTVYDLKLTDALVGSFENDPGSKGVETALERARPRVNLHDPAAENCVYSEGIGDSTKTRRR